MTVQFLIDELSKIKDKEKEIRLMILDQEYIITGVNDEGFYYSPVWIYHD